MGLPYIIRVVLLVFVVIVYGRGGVSAQLKIGKTQGASVFPRGEKISSVNFNGATWLNALVNSDSLNDIKVGSVTFDPGARTNWHRHPSGQILLVLSGTGYYQERGGGKKILHPGDVIKCPPNVAHWHGASKDDSFVQVAVTATSKGETVWLEPVTAAEYDREAN